MQNLQQLFVLCTASQIIGGDFTKFCDLLRLYELYPIHTILFQRFFLFKVSFLKTTKKKRIGKSENIEMTIFFHKTTPVSK